MAGLVPAIHVLAAGKDVDARPKAGHDGGSSDSKQSENALGGSSRPLSLLATEQAVGLERKNEQQRRERDDVFHRACDIHPAEVLDDAEEKTAGDRAWN